MNAALPGTSDLEGSLGACYGALGFDSPPFNITPDTDFFVPQAQYMEAIGHLRFGMASGSFTLLTGDVGLGKTLLCRYLLENLPSSIRTAYIFNPQQSYSELLASIIHDLTGIMPGRKRTNVELHDELFGVLANLASRGQRVALLIDEAHCLPAEILEGLRLLSNFETGKRKLISLLLVGQNELEATLQTEAMRALRQRISVWYRLRPFSRQESSEYIRDRLAVVNRRGDFEITRTALWLAHHHSGGVPRRLNQICDRSMLAAFAAGQRRVGAGLMQRSAREVNSLNELKVTRRAHRL